MNALFCKKTSHKWLAFVLLSFEHCVEMRATRKPRLELIQYFAYAVELTQLQFDDETEYFLVGSQVIKKRSRRCCGARLSPSRKLLSGKKWRKHTLITIQALLTII
jgi:hypothetical protein